MRKSFDINNFYENVFSVSCSERSHQTCILHCVWKTSNCLMTAERLNDRHARLRLIKSQPGMH